MTDYTRERRWSEVIPPHTALSFAAIWDPEEGMVTFSGGQLLTSDMASEARYELPRDTDGYSQVLTLDNFSFPMTDGYCPRGGGRVPTVAFTLADALDEGQSVLDPFLRQNAQWRRAGAGPTERAQKRQGVIHLDLKAASAAMASFRNRLLHPFSPTAETAERPAGFDEFFEDVPVTAGTSTSAPVLVHLNLKSAFSMTDTSTAGYVDIDTPSVYSQASSTYESVTPALTTSTSEAWSTLRSLDVHHTESCPNTRGGPRRLRKRRPSNGNMKPADPREVLARAEFNHVRDSSASSPCPSAFDKSRHAGTNMSLHDRARLALSMKSDVPPPPVPTQTRSAPTTPQKERPQKVIHRLKSLPRLPKITLPPSSPVSSSLRGTAGCETPTASSPKEMMSSPPTSFAQSWPRGRQLYTPDPDAGGRTLRRERSMTRLVKQSVQVLTRCRKTSASSTTPCAREGCDGAACRPAAALSTRLVY